MRGGVYIGARAGRVEQAHAVRRMAHVMAAPPKNREYNDAEAAELVRTVRAARATPRGPMIGRLLFVLTAVGPLVVFGILVATSLDSPRAVVHLWPLMMIAVLVFTVAYFGCVWVRRRFKKRVLARDAKVCPNCHYDLSEVQDVGEVQFCPECREPFRFGDLKRVWSGFAPGMVWWD